MAMRCHYEVLGVERAADAGEIRRAFRLLALRWHPDKLQQQGVASAEATARFQELQSAYEVLGDPHERKWYDDHREQILRGGDGDGDGDDELDLFRFFRCVASVAHITAASADQAAQHGGLRRLRRRRQGILRGLRRALRQGALLITLDGRMQQRLTTAGQVEELDVRDGGEEGEMPRFGGASAAADDVARFYQHWRSYVTRRSFAWVDEYKTTDAPSRQIRRAMEKENKKLRDAARKAFTTEVRELVEFVYRRDKRMQALLKQKEREREQKRLEEEAKKRERQAAYDAERLAFQQQEHERWESEQQTSRVTDQHIAMEMEQLRKKLDAEVLVCDLCNKTFKSTKQLKNHLTSKKHRDKEQELGISTDFNLLEEEMERELREELAAAGKLKISDDNEAVADNSDRDEVPKSADVDSTVQASEPDPDEEGRAQKRLEAEQIRLEKEQKAADKRKERKEQRKQKKKEGVEKIVTAARTKQEKDEEEEENGRRKGKKGGRKKVG